MTMFKISQGIYRLVLDNSHPIIYAYNLASGPREFTYGNRKTNPLAE